MKLLKCGNLSFAFIIFQLNVHIFGKTKQLADCMLGRAGYRVQFPESIRFQFTSLESINHDSIGFDLIQFNIDSVSDTKT